MLNNFSFIEEQRDSQKFLEFEDILSHFKKKKNFYIFSSLAIIFFILVIFSTVNQFLKLLPGEELNNTQLFFLLKFFCMFKSAQNSRYTPIYCIFVVSLNTYMFTTKLSAFTLYHPYTFIFGFLICLGYLILLDSVGAYKYLCFFLVVVAHFIQFSMEGKEILFGGLLVLNTSIILVFLSIDESYTKMYQKKSISYMVLAHNELLKRQSEMEKLFYRPSIIIDKQLDNLFFMSSTFQTSLKENWACVLANTLISKDSLEKIYHSKINDDYFKTLLSFLVDFNNKTYHEPNGKTLTGFLDSKYYSAINSKTIELFNGEFKIPFKIKIMQVSIFNKPYYFIEFEESTELLENLSQKSIEKQRVRMLSSISHDLKTPITACITWCGNLKNVSSIHIFSKTVAQIHNSLKRMIFNISIMMLNSDLQDDKQKKSAKVTCFHASEVIHNLCSILDGEAQGKNVKLSVNPDDPRFNIFNDRTFFFFINYILISNAITHSEESEIIIDLKLIKDPKTEEPLLEISIEDFGCGMEVDVLTKIQNLDFRPSKENSLQGAFFGIATVFQILKYISPSNLLLDVQSQKGKGTKFKYWVYVWHPAAKYLDKNIDEIYEINTFDEDEEILNSYEETRQKNIVNTMINDFTPLVDPKLLAFYEEKMNKLKLTKEVYESLKILIVDDVFYNVESLSVVLNNLGLRNQQKFVSSSTALKYLEQNKNFFDILMVDYQMPEFNGYELSCIARENELISKNCKIILVTAAHEISLNYFEKPVINRIIEKPYTPKIIFGEILQCFENSSIKVTKQMWGKIDKVVQLLKLD